MTPDAVDRAVAAEYPHLIGIRPVRYAGARPPSTLVWRTVVPGVGTVRREGPALVAEAALGPARAWPGTPALSPDDQRALQLLHARLAREQRRARAQGIAPVPWQTDAITVPDLEVLAHLLDSGRVALRAETEPRQPTRYVGTLVAALTAWLDSTPITPRTVDDPLEPVHETRCALVWTARRLVGQILLAHGVPAPERM